MYVSVAVMDTGIFRHMDFDTRIAGFADFVGRKKYLYDDNGHGTHVAGIIAGSGKGSNGKYRGIAPDTFLVIINRRIVFSFPEIYRFSRYRTTVYTNSAAYTFIFFNIRFFLKNVQSSGKSGPHIAAYLGTVHIEIGVSIL